MPKTKRTKLSLSSDDRATLIRVTLSRTEPIRRVERAQILLAYADDPVVSHVMATAGYTRYQVGHTVDKAVAFGYAVALDDLPRSGRNAVITPAAKTWLINLACTKPKDHGYSYELWSQSLLAEHARKHATAAGHPCLSRLGYGTVSKLLSRADIKPHKIAYYLERRDPEFEPKMAQVLYLYKEIELWREKEPSSRPYAAVLSYDEKPGIQAIEGVAPDLLPEPGKYATLGRDYEYIRHGTLSLLCGIDLLSGHVYGITRERHRSREFVEWLKLIDDTYPKGTSIRVLLDNHSAHISKETKAYLATRKGRFEFTFTPKHGSWLNLVESFFGKMARTVLRGIRVASKDELKLRLEQYLHEINLKPVVYKWKAGLDKIKLVDG